MNSPFAGNTMQSRGDSSPKRCSVELSLLDEPLDSFSGASVEQMEKKAGLSFSSSSLLLQGRGAWATGGRCVHRAL